MYPSPQDAVPLLPRGGPEHYTKQAEDLVSACRSGEPKAIRVWAMRWIEEVAALEGEADRPADAEQIDRRVDQLEQFASGALSRDQLHATCALADAQFVIARAYGFVSWAELAQHLELLADADSPIAAFEAAADAIVTGDRASLERLLRAHPRLIRSRSTREHRATLLHYVSANGVEHYRQKTPKNAAAIAQLLLEMGAEVDAQADVYGGGCTTLGLVVTSVHPFIAGVQRELIDVLLEYGARMDHPGSTGNRHALVRGCLANGRPEAAEYLLSRGAPLDLPGAAGAGRLGVVQTFFDDDGGSSVNATNEQMLDGFSLACVYGRTNVVGFLLERGIDVNAEIRAHGDGHTALHVAAFHGHVDLVKTLLGRGARVDAIDKTWGTPPLVWGLTGWCDRAATPAARYYQIVGLLVAAGAIVTRELLEWDRVRADPQMLAALMRQKAF